MKAADWNESLIWTGRCRIVASKPFGGEDSKDETAEIKFEDSSTGDLFAAAPYDSTQVSDDDLQPRCQSLTPAAGCRARLGLQQILCSPRRRPIQRAKSLPRHGSVCFI